MGREDAFYYVYTDETKRGGKWEESEFFATGEVEIAHLMARITDVGGCQRSRALDFGCGPGRLTQALADHFEAVVGVDIAESMIALANRLNRKGDRCTFVRNTATDLRSFADQSFDLVYTSEVLQHMRPRYALRYLAEFFRVAKTGGVVAFQIPDPTPRQWRREHTPAALVSLRRYLRNERGPVMQMFGVGRAALGRVASEGNGAFVFDEERAIGAGYPGHLYIFRKA
jgi:ubiquinone/menaquinone biosynthesis C-methylase UbiE